MKKTINILSDDSKAASVARKFYDNIADEAGFSIQWVKHTDTSDAILLTGRENYHALTAQGYTTVVSDNSERRLVAVFGNHLESLINSATVIKLAVDFEWQGEMISRFLSRALPASWNWQLNFETANEHTDERLQRLNAKRIDVAIVPLQHLNYSGISPKAYRYMILPLFECPPSIYQGITALAAKQEHATFLAALRQAVNKQTAERSAAELEFVANNPGYQSGVIALKLANISFTYAGSPAASIYTGGWKKAADTKLSERQILFSTTDHMKDFFDYDFNDVAIIPGCNNYFVATHKAVEAAAVAKQIKGKTLWAAGTRTWFELARKDYWVSGSADGLGLESLSDTWSGGFAGVSKTDLCIITNSSSAKHWQRDGYTAVGTYDLVPRLTPAIISGLRNADAVFWTSYQQYETCKQYLQPTVTHAAPAGKTATLIKEDGNSNVVVFPSIKAFIEYRQNAETTRSL